MQNSSKTLFQAFVKKGMTDRDAIFAVIDHWNTLHWDDRNRLTEENKRLKDRLARLDKASHAE